MHEMSIVEALLDTVRQEVGTTELARVQTVRVRLGQLRLVVPETLTFCYAAATRATSLAGSQLEIKEVAARAQCRECGAEFPVEENWFECSRCHALNGTLLAGNELDLVSIELKESQEVVPAG